MTIILATIRLEFEIIEKNKFLDSKLLSLDHLLYDCFSFDLISIDENLV